MNIRGAKTEFAFSLFEEQLARIFALKLFYDKRSIIGRSIINDQHVKLLVKRKYSLYDIGYVLFFIVGGYDDDLFQPTIC